MKTSIGSDTDLPITSDEMRTIEQEAIASGRVTGLELMERAGQGVVEAIFEEWPDLAKGSHHAVVLCGPGNNGGDGFVVARLLSKAGWGVEALVLGTASNYSSDAATMLAKIPTQVLTAFVSESMGHALSSAIFENDIAVVVDAVFGIGLSRPLSDGMAGLLCQDFSLYREHDLGTKCVSVDIPSGLSAESGAPLGDAFKAHLTVTFHRLKHGHVNGIGNEYCGKIVVKDIGL
jgi:hydroxyethylthiazole kinase-like uncharacterized protein yjeF